MKTDFAKKEKYNSISTQKFSILYKKSLSPQKFALYAQKYSVHPIYFSNLSEYPGIIMKKNNWLTSSILLVSVVGVLGLTTPSYVGCEDFFPDEFLDLGLLCQHPVLPILTPHLNTYPSHLSSVKTADSQKLRLLTIIMRC
ncbi:MAG TPA: hypothetical protein VMV04_02225 [Thermodesulfobacteriota bacterium]|nr:hypothetical protein [Thermodesulfobacteriota bacterium]